MNTEYSYQMKRVEYKNKKNLYWLVAIILFISPETLLFGTNNNKVLSLLPTILPFLLLLFLNLRKGYKLETKYKFSLISAFFVVPLFITALVNFDTSPTYIIMAVATITGFTFVQRFKFEDFIVVFEKLIYVIVVFSVLMFIISRLYPPVLSLFPSLYNTQNNHFYNALLCVFPSFMDSGWLDRLWGPFREPGVFQMYINIAFLIYIYTHRRLSVVHVSAYVVAIIFTQSTTGYIVLAINLLYYTLYVRRRFSFQAFLIIILLIFGIYYLNTTTTLLSNEGKVFYKLTESGESAAFARIASIWGNIHLFLSNPITGVGYSNMNELFASYSLSAYGEITIHNTNTVLYQFASLGFLYGTIWFLGFIFFFKKFGNNIATSLCCVVGQILSFMGENISGNLLVYIILGYGVMALFSEKKRY